jgi:hypothetical protein
VLDLKDKIGVGVEVLERPTLNQNDVDVVNALTRWGIAWPRLSERWPRYPMIPTLWMSASWQPCALWGVDHMVSLPWVDLLLIGSLAAFTIYGLMQGLVYQLATFIGLVMGLLLAMLGYYNLAQIFGALERTRAGYPRLWLWLDPSADMAAFAHCGVWARQRARKRDDWGDDLGGAVWASSWDCAL